jgi:excisionase family DNA binding protein
MDPLMTSDEVATFLRVDVVTIRRLVNRGELPAYRVGGEYRFTKADLENYLQRQRISGEEEAGNNPPDITVQLTRKLFSGDRFAKFTDQARGVLALAQKQAQHNRHNYIGTEHLLLGLVDQNEGVAAQVLGNLGIKPEQVHSTVKAIIGQGKRFGPGEVGLTPRAKKVIELATDEAHNLGHHYIGTEHLLLGLIRQGDGIAANVLSSMGADLEKVRSETIKVLNAESTTYPPVPTEAGSLLAEGEQGIICSRCGANNSTYFHYCFNCGQQLSS